MQQCQVSHCGKTACCLVTASGRSASHCNITCAERKYNPYKQYSPFYNLVAHALVFSSVIKCIFLMKNGYYYTLYTNKERAVEVVHKTGAEKALPTAPDHQNHYLKCSLSSIIIFFLQGKQTFSAQF